MLSRYVLENLWKTEFLIRKYRGCMGFFLEDRIMHSILAALLSILKRPSHA